MGRKWALALLLLLASPLLALSPGRSAVVVVVDPGHGGRDPGATVAGVEEKDLVLGIALTLKLLSEGGPVEVVLTRSSDRYVELKERVAFAERIGAALYVSIHANACDSPDVRGIETYVDSSRPPSDPSWRLAEEIQRALCRRTGAPDRGVRTQKLYLRHTRLPAVLVEVGYLTNSLERERLLDPAYRRLVAQGILEGIISFLGFPQ